jgi:hypothetical protein
VRCGGGIGGGAATGAATRADGAISRLAKDRYVERIRVSTTVLCLCDVVSTVDSNKNGN